MALLTIPQHRFPACSRQSLGRKRETKLNDATAHAPKAWQKFSIPARRQVDMTVDKPLAGNRRWTHPRPRPEDRCNSSTA
jgi:hypothetical protein